jgi:endonuclease/exonuclease/phosphatase family metal-dependent hydrolase
MNIRVLSWNVEHFKDNSKIDAVVALIQAENPDVFALYEVEKMDILTLMQDHFPTFTFQITDGPEKQEILVGYRALNNTQAMFTQKREFKAYNPYLRPGALLTLCKQGEYLNFLFLHTDSGTDAPAFGNRAEMLEKVSKLKKSIDKIAGDTNGNLVVTGDFNTMGLFFPTSKKSDESVAASREIQALDESSSKSNMSLRVKEFDATWSNGSKQSDLDHVLASNSLAFKDLGTRIDNQQSFQVAVRGWQQLSGTKRKNFIDTISDHCALVFEVQF